MRLLLLLGLASGLTPAVRAQPVAQVVRQVLVCPATDQDTAPPMQSAACTRSTPDAVDPQDRALWLLGEIRLPAASSQSREPLGVLVQAMASSAIYWDGEHIGTSGVVSSDGAREIPGQFLHLVPLRSEEVLAGTHTIAVKMSSHRGPLRVRAPVHAIVVAPAQMLLDGIGGASQVTLLALGALLLAALYFLAIAARVASRGDAAVLAAMIACALVQGGAELWRSLVPITYVDQIWRLLVILGAATGLGVTLVWYLARRFAATHQATLVVLTAAASAVAWTLPGFDRKTLYVLALAIAVATLIAARAAWARRPGAGAILAVLMLLGLAGAFEGSVFLDRDLFVGLTLLTLVLLVDSVSEARRAQHTIAEARAQIGRLELELLRRRIAPHWLLNTLNAVMAWIEEEPTTAVRMVGMLGDEFRRLAQVSDARLIPLSDELAACRRLLELMSLRTGHTHILDADDVSPTVLVPPGVLHTLVENALTHGGYRGGAIFTVRQRGSQDRPQLEFVAPAAAVDLRPAAEDGLGLTYVRARLTEAFGAAGTLVHGPTDHGGWRTILHLGVASA
jgi:hypothetical protein